MPSGRIAAIKPLETDQISKPLPPKYLDRVAKREYLTLVDVLDKGGKLAQTDPKLIELYAINYSMLMRAVEELAASPSMLDDRGKPHPMIAVVHNTTTKLRQLVGDFALSPVTSKLVESNLPTSDASAKWRGVL